MRAGGGKHKGKQYELHIARRLSSWWFPERDWKGVPAKELPFRRTPLSGGWDKKRAPVDVFTDAPDFPFWVECKKRQGWSFDQVMRNPQTFPPLTWYRDEEKKMQEVVAKYPEARRHLLLFFSRNNMPDFVLMSYCTYLEVMAGDCEVQFFPGLKFRDPESLTNSCLDFFIITTADELLGIRKDWVLECLEIRADARREREQEAKTTVGQ